jgi:hypothetical protein
MLENKHEDTSPEDPLPSDNTTQHLATVKMLATALNSLKQKKTVHWTEFKHMRVGFSSFQSSTQPDPEWRHMQTDNITQIVHVTRNDVQTQKNLCLAVFMCKFPARISSEKGM